MSKPLKQVIIYSENEGDDVEAKVNEWLSNRANNVFEHEIVYFGASHYLVAVITYWEEK